MRKTIKTQQESWTEEQWYQYWKEHTDKTHWTHFDSIQDIPDVPVVSKKIYSEIFIPAFLRCGAIPKKELVVGKTYIGACRNASEAVWNGQDFEYQRYKFGRRYTDTCNHFEDYTEYDIFIPIKEKNE